MKSYWHNIFNDFKKVKVLIVGDAMIDSYMWGSINRQSPEADIPIVDIEKYEKRLGGAWWCRYFSNMFHHKAIDHQVLNQIQHQKY